MNIAWEEHQVLLKQGDMSHRSPLNVVLWALGQFAVEVPLEFTHRINTMFIVLLIQQGLGYMPSLAAFASVVLVCSIVGGIVNLVILCFAVRYAVKKTVIFCVCTFYLALVIIACWTYNIYVFGILLFFTAWLPQAAVSLHGSQVPFVSTGDLHQFADHLSILMSTLTNFLYLYMARAFPNLKYFNLNGQALSLITKGQDIEKPTGTFILSTAICVFAFILLIPYMFLKEHITKPPIRQLSYNIPYIFNNFRMVIGDMIRDKNFIMFLLCVIGTQYAPLYTTVLFHTVQSDIFHTDTFMLEIKENIFFYAAVVSFFISPPLLHKFGPRCMMIIILSLVAIMTCFQQFGLLSGVFGYIGCVFAGFASSTTNVTIRRFIYENSTYDTISMHYGVVAILCKIVNSLAILLSVVYQLQENNYFYVRFFAIVMIFFITSLVGLVASVFMRDHHTDYCNGLRPPYVKNTIIIEKD
ncbi:hypothetical protein EIN_176660 [Entamoeba invadens IP1]|uniref:hypothetical protein n=1 Tax=Entamoeba invadens IP1 TaxID=370355 RepID=UPI0002C3E6FE|nr:hypothetical protein EIN_176660 [Entamoeba invadens IP1]ELP93839.1 hypothetical protein EIN_176660 [Entamoeba invadens IP1]|eukprot:XP_004260610.1 hypothetical protein EIN_176660 [Entamoeba invadens IP1]